MLSYPPFNRETTILRNNGCLLVSIANQPSAITVPQPLHVIFIQNILHQSNFYKCDRTMSAPCQRGVNIMSVHPCFSCCRLVTVSDSRTGGGCGMFSQFSPMTAGRDDGRRAVPCRGLSTPCHRGQQEVAGCPRGATNCAAAAQLAVAGSRRHRAWNFPARARIHHFVSALLAATIDSLHPSSALPWQPSSIGAF